MIKSNRATYAALLFITISLGLIGRRLAFVPLAVGDALWAVAVFWVLHLLNPQAKTSRLALFALLISYAIEFSQLWQASWLVKLRSTLPGKLLLGQGFLYSDLIAYSLGISVVVLIKWYISTKISKRAT
ncbi:ribosomal maturation YjgA family protein [Siphonobacter curvatus]|uniref:DUF2809 domain-containing protein n=1 Tax=Siphonobacter curvatus TaxID=2094562 RepID=A0A2S7IP50_9BACT|nr:DUF2809 domain-containing protein [Siphonobacter curvatus]PQA59503.1 DUF2809 domain-containing protein [Siphonobacter curvatus]